MSMTDFNKKLMDLEIKVNKHAKKIEECQDTIKRIESQLEHNNNEFKKDHAILSDKVDRNHNAASITHDEAMAMLTYICDKLKITLDQIPQNNKATQYPNSSYT